jgi:hypothetical protein
MNTDRKCFAAGDGRVEASWLLFGQRILFGSFLFATGFTKIEMQRLHGKAVAFCDCTNMHPKPKPNMHPFKVKNLNFLSL